jgi:translation initiation factor IF-1
MAGTAAINPTPRPCGVVQVKSGIEMNGVIRAAHADFKFSVELSNGQSVVCYLAGLLRKNRIICVPGDCVVVELSHYFDPANAGRIIWRNTR